MRVATVSKEVYSFNELEQSAKDAAIADNYEINIYDGWHEFIYEDAIAIGKLMGIEIDNIYFSGFASQGDGACFEGSYQYIKGCVKAVKEYAPKDTELHSIVERLAAVQKRWFYGLLAYVKQSGHYYHEYCTRISVEHNYNSVYVNGDAEEEITDILRDFMRWIYKSLETEYDYQTSEAAIIETFEANEYEFTVDGKMY